MNNEKLNLSNAQIRSAIDAFENRARYAEINELLTMGQRMERAAPFLQLPWEEPDGIEVGEIQRYVMGASDREVIDVGMTRRLCSEFVRRRNAQLLPKPPDLRYPAIHKVLTARCSGGDTWADETAIQILAALDEAGR